MLKTGVTIVLLCSMVSAFANQTGTDYANDQATVNNARSSVTTTQQDFSPNSELPGYTPNPAQTHDYSGVTGGDNDIKDKGASALSKDAAGGTVYKAFTTRPKIRINTASTDFVDSNLAKNDSYNITHGISDHYVDCKRHHQCRTVNTTQQCTKTNSVSVSCTNTPTVTVAIEPYLAPIPKPCQHIVVLSDNVKPPVGGTLVSTISWYLHKRVYLVPGESADNACYIPGSFRVEHDRDQHGTSVFHALASATYFLYGQAWYYNSDGIADLFVQVGGKTVARTQAHSNQGSTHTTWAAIKDETVVLNGYNHGFDDSDYDAAFSAYWASTPLKQTHKVAHVTWHESCQGGEHA